MQDGIGKSFIDAVSREIRTIASAIVRKSVTKDEFHHQLQNEIFELGRKYGCDPKREYHIKVPGEKRQEQIDVVWTRHGGVYAAFELDSSLRPKSVWKLVTVNPPYPFWVYYGHRDFQTLLQTVRENDAENITRIVKLNNIYFAKNEKRDTRNLGRTYHGYGNRR